MADLFVPVIPFTPWDNTQRMITGEEAVPESGGARFQAGWERGEEGMTVGQVFDDVGCFSKAALMVESGNGRELSRNISC